MHASCAPRCVVCLDVVNMHGRDAKLGCAPAIENRRRPPTPHAPCPAPSRASAGRVPCRVQCPHPATGLGVRGGPSRVRHGPCGGHRGLRPLVGRAAGLVGIGTGHCGQVPHHPAPAGARGRRGQGLAKLGRRAAGHRGSLDVRAGPVRRRRHVLRHGGHAFELARGVEGVSGLGGVGVRGGHPHALPGPHGLRTRTSPSALAGPPPPSPSQTASRPNSL